MNALRYSVEWSRVQPSADTIDQDALDHYTNLTNYCLSRGIAPVVTLHHFTNPNWLTEKGGWEDKEVVDVFTHYVKTVTEALPEEGLRYVVINEPNSFALMGWALGLWPPQRHNPLKYHQVAGNLIEAHKKSYDVIKDTAAGSPVSSAVQYIHFDAKVVRRIELTRDLLGWVSE